MRSDGHGIGVDPRPSRTAQTSETHRQRGSRLHRIGVHQRTVRTRDGSELGNRLHRADFSVGETDRHERRVVPDNGLEARRMHQAVAVDGQLRDVEAEDPGEISAALQHRRVLDRGGDDVSATGVCES